MTDTMKTTSEHHLKTWPSYFQSVLDGIKTFEVRKADRDFQTGDCLHLKEWCPIHERFTGRAVLRRVEYTLYGGQFGIEEGYVVMGISDGAELTRLRADLAAARETNKTLADELGFIKTQSAIPAPGCNYLTPAGMICFKCGKVHSGTKLALALSATGAVEGGGEDIHIIDNRTPDSINTIVGAAKWIRRIADRYDDLPALFLDSTPKEGIAGLANELFELARQPLPKAPTSKQEGEV